MTKKILDMLWLIKETIISFLWLNILRRKPLWGDAEECDRLCCRYCGKGKINKTMEEEIKSYRGKRRSEFDEGAKIGTFYGWILGMLTAIVIVAFLKIFIM